MSEPIIIEQTFDAPVDELWKAITDRDRMVQWYFEQIEAFEPRVGFRTSFLVSFDGKHYDHQWQVTDVEPGKRIAYSWRYRDIPGDGAVDWRISAEEDGSKLTFINTGIESFPEDDPAFSRQSAEQGWNFFIRERLKQFLDGGQGAAGSS